MITCIAIDDEPKALGIIRHHCARIPFLSLEDCFLDPFAAMAFLREKPVDLVFLDINMPDLSGLDLARLLLPKPLLIFTTAHSEYALASYEVEAVDYLLKPFDFARLLAAVNKVSDRLKSGSLVSTDFFFVNAGAHKQRLVYQDLYYIESEGNYLNYVGKHGKTLVRSSIKEALELLPAQLFVQIHRSFLVSMAWIEKIEDHHVFIAQRKIAIGPTYREAFYKRITPSQKG